MDLKFIIRYTVGGIFELADTCQLNLGTEYWGKHCCNSRCALDSAHDSSSTIHFTKASPPKKSYPSVDILISLCIEGKHS